MTASGAATRWRSPTGSPKERYFDPDFFALEAEQLWPRVWQMACRLEEIPEPGDFVEYEILDQSVVVVRTDDGEVRAFQNACRHRGVQVVEGRGTCDERVHLPVPRLVLRPRRHEHLRVRSGAPSPSTTCSPATSTSCRCAARRGAAAPGSTSTTTPRRCAQCIEPAATILDAWKVESLRAEWWYAVPPPGELEARRGGVPWSSTTCSRRTRSSASPARYPPRDGSAFDPRAFVDAELQYLRTMSEGMAGMVHANDVRIAEGLRDIELPAEPALAMATWHRTLNDAVAAWHRDARLTTSPTSTSSRRAG